MQLAYDTLLKLNSVSKMEMNFFLQCVRYQDEHRRVIGVYYKEFMQVLGMKSKQTFYNVLRSLSEKNLLSYTQNVKGDFDIYLENRTFSQQKTPDYIDLNKVLFQSKEFFKMKAHEKYMLLDLMRSTALNRGIRVINTVTIKPNETYKLKVSDKPTLDPVGVLLGKVDKETNQNKPEGSLSLEGALFTAKFYAGVQSDSDPAVEGKTANRTWIFRTNEDGFCYYEEKYLESGDELYLSPTKNPSLPIGTLTIQETKAPEGYLINPEVYTVKITSNNNGSEFVYTYNQPTIPEQSLDLNIVKKEKGKEYAIEGAVFEHTKPDGTTETVTTDANGVCKFKTLGYGQHKIREVSVPDEYTVNEGVVTFTVAKDNSITLDSNTATDESMKFQVEANGTASLGVEDTLAPYQLKVTKLNEKEKALENAEFTIYEDKDCTKEISKIVTDDTGVATTDPLVVEKKYYVKETKAPQGYRIPKDVNGNDYVYEIYTKYNDKRQYEYYVNGEVHTKDSGDYAIEGTPHERIVNLKIENRTGLQMPETGTHTTLLIVLLGVACMSVGIVHQFKKGRRKGNEKNDKI